MYRVLVYIHILSAMAWVGGGFMLMILERQALRVDGTSGLARFLEDNEWVDKWVFTPAPLLVVATGVTMVLVEDAWSFGQPWVYLALALIVTEFVMGGREMSRMKRAREEGIDSPAFTHALRAYARMGPFAIGLLATVVLLMVFKPGA